VNSWFHVIQEVARDFVSDERIVWVDIEGVPLYAWSRETFARIGKKWGETLNIEDTNDSSFGRKRVCIVTKHPTSILDSFKIIFKGKEKLYNSDDESVHEGNCNEVQPHLSEVGVEDKVASDDEGVADTVFEVNSPSPKNFSGDIGVQQSDDPFELYDLLKKKKPEVETSEPSPSLSHPPGFTPVASELIKEDGQEENSCESVGQCAANYEGSVLGVLEEVIRVGHAMGYTMEGCEKDIESWQQEKKEWVKELANNNKLSFIAIQETKLNRVSHMDVKFMWGNSNYDFVCSDSLGNSGRILCIWESTVFKKDNVTISDSFVAIYGTWLPSNSKILFVIIYAPQQVSYKRILWEYISSLIGRWNRDAILMGDFNEVRSREEIRGLSFNPASARVVFFCFFLPLRGFAWIDTYRITVRFFSVKLK
nr:RNA-directed DNA polymerase, eukaryota [Tanacetum cinerariifolium]